MAADEPRAIGGQVPQDGTPAHIMMSRCIYEDMGLAVVVRLPEREDIL